jgi:hypothetical protein
MSIILVHVHVYVQVYVHVHIPVYSYVHITESTVGLSDFGLLDRIFFKLTKYGLSDRRSRKPVVLSDPDYELELADCQTGLKVITAAENLSPGTVVPPLPRPLLSLLFSDLFGLWSRVSSAALKMEEKSQIHVAFFCARLLSLFHAHFFFGLLSFFGFAIVSVKVPKNREHLPLFLVKVPA